METENKDNLMETINPNSVPFCNECPIENDTRVYCTRCANEQIKRLEKFSSEVKNRDEEEYEEESR